MWFDDGYLCLKNSVLESGTICGPPVDCPSLYKLSHLLMMSKVASIKVHPEASNYSIVCSLGS